MNEIKSKYLLIAAILFAASAACFGQALEIHHINVGQGDATLIICPNGKTILIDGGKDKAGEDFIVPRLDSMGIRILNSIIATHMDADHIGGLDEVLESGITVKKVLDNGSVSTSGEYKDYVEAVTKYVGSRTTIKPGYKIKLGDGATARCIYSNGSCINGLKMEVTKENDRSVCFLIDYDCFSYFIGGDLGGGGTGHKDVESFIAPKVGNIDVLRVNHHGSNSSTSDYFLDTLTPEAAIISVGANSYGHPAEDVLDRLDSRNIDVMQTGAGDNPHGKVMGDIVVVAKPGKKYWIDGSVRKKDKYIRPKNTPPTADFSYTSDCKTVTFDASSSTDDGKIKHYFWNYGDGTTESGRKKSVVTHTYKKEGNYIVFLSVLDNFGIADKTEKTAFVGTEKSISVSAYASPQYPKRYTYVKIYVTVHDQSCNPVDNASLKVVIHYSTKDTIIYGATSSDGKRVFDRYIGPAKADYKVWVDVTASYEGMKAYTSTWFTPHN